MPSTTRPPDLPVSAAGGTAAPGPAAAASPAAAPGPAAPGPAAPDPAAPGPAAPGPAALPGPGSAADPPWAGLRLVTVPSGWPPYDCEAHGAACPAAEPDAGSQPPRPPAAGEAILACHAVPAYAEASAKTGMASGAAASGAAAADEPGGSGPGQAPRLSAGWPGQFAQVLVEVLAGYRPAKQLVPLTTERARAQIDLLGYAVAPGQRPRIRRIMTSRPAAGVVEMTIVVGFGTRSRALAMRLEHIPARCPAPGRPARPARWLCTEIETS